jgi:hypothetical protein
LLLFFPFCGKQKTKAISFSKSKGSVRTYGGFSLFCIHSYGKLYGGGMCGSRDIVPMSEKEIKIWAETHLIAGEYMKL